MLDTAAISIEETPAEGQGSVQFLPLSLIGPGDNPRRYRNPQKHADLVASIRLRGVLQPILLRPAPEADGLFVIVAGERRYRAALEALGPDGQVPVAIRAMTDQEALEAAIDENDNREDASETEQADAAVRVLAACGDDRAEAARRLAWPPSKLDRRLALANLSDAVKLALDERRIKVGHAELLAAIPPDKQDKALETIVAADLAVGKTRELLMRVTQNLAAAIFDKEDCGTCRFNSATQAALFAVHVEGGHCTNSGCFDLKTETAEKARKDTDDQNSGAASANGPAEAMPREPGPSTPDREAGPSSSGPSPAPAKPPTRPSGAAKVKVTAKSLADRFAADREAVWRLALSDALTEEKAAGPHTTAALVGVVRSAARDRLDFDHVARLAQGFAVDLRGSWRVDKAFLAKLGKDELKFVAQECGLIAHMGEKAFAKLLEKKSTDIATAMLHATGFDWTGRLPSCVTLDGQYGPPPSDPAPGMEPAGRTSAEPAPSAEGGREDTASC